MESILTALDALAAMRNTIEHEHGAMHPGLTDAIVDGLREERDADLCDATAEGPELAS